MKYLIPFVCFSNICFSEDKNITEIFENIYKNGIWGRTTENYGHSGNGSHPVNAKPYFYFLENFLVSNKIRSIVDAGCGDWQFSRYLNLENIDYLGVDASETIILNNLINYSKNNINFTHGNFLDMNLPKADLLILKDVLQHLSFSNIWKSLDLFKNYKFVIIVNDILPDVELPYNIDIIDGDYRPLDITKEPFNIMAETVLTYKMLVGQEVKAIHLIKNNL